MKRDDAEDLWLACIVQAPAYMDHCLVRRRHLSPRGQHVLAKITGQYEAGYDTIDLGRLGLPDEALRSIPARLGGQPAQARVAEAEKQIVSEWAKGAYALALRKAAEVAEREGPEAADASLWAAQAKIRAESTGIEWRSAAHAVKAWLAGKRAWLERSANGELGSGFSSVDFYANHYPGKWCSLVQGYTGDGKSTFTLQILAGLASAGKHTHYISLEDEDAIMGGRLVAIFIDDVRSLLRLDHADFGPEELEAVEALLSQGLETLPLSYVHRPEWTVEQTCAGIVDAGRKGSRVIAVDYIQKLLRKGDDPARDLEIYGNAMKSAASSVGAHLVIVSQIIRPEGSKRARADLPPPTLFSAKGGGIETLAEAIFCPFRPKKDTVKGMEPAVIIVPKVKQGPTTTLPFFWDTERHIYVSPEQHQRQLSENGWHP